MCQINFAIATMLCLAMSSGCSSLNSEKKRFGKEREVESVKPSKIVAIWTNSVFNEPGQAPVRGLGGRVYFYDDEHHAVPVDGKFSVFLYDDTKPDGKLKQEATKTVHFLSDQMAANFSPSQFGPSYSFWVPWDSVGGPRTQLAIIPVFTDNKGQMLVGEQAKHMLPGSAPIEPAESTPEVAQAGYSDNGRSAGKLAQTSAARAGQESDPKVTVKSSTIKLPPSMQRRVRSKPPKREHSRFQHRTSIYDRTKLMQRLPEFRKAAVKKESNDKEPESETNENSPPLVHSRLGQLQARISPFAQPKYDPARSPLGPGEPLFVR